MKICFQTIDSDTQNTFILCFQFDDSSCFVMIIIQNKTNNSEVQCFQFEKHEDPIKANLSYLFHSNIQMIFHYYYLTKLQNLIQLHLCSHITNSIRLIYHMTDLYLKDQQFEIMNEERNVDLSSKFPHDDLFFDTFRIITVFNNVNFNRIEPGTAIDVLRRVGNSNIRAAFSEYSDDEISDISDDEDQVNHRNQLYPTQNRSFDPIEPVPTPMSSVYDLSEVSSLVSEYQSDVYSIDSISEFDYSDNMCFDPIPHSRNKKNITTTNDGCQFFNEKEESQLSIEENVRLSATENNLTVASPDYYSELVNYDENEVEEQSNNNHLLFSQELEHTPFRVLYDDVNSGSDITLVNSEDSVEHLLFFTDSTTDNSSTSRYFTCNEGQFHQSLNANSNQREGNDIRVNSGANTSNRLQELQSLLRMCSESILKYEQNEQSGVVNDDDGGEEFNNLLKYREYLERMILDSVTDIY